MAEVELGHRRAVVNVVGLIALGSTLVGGALAVRQYDSLNNCSWYSGALIGNTVASGLLIVGIAVAILRRGFLQRALVRAVGWLAAISVIVVLLAWFLYADKYASCPID